VDITQDEHDQSNGIRHLRKTPESKNCNKTVLLPIHWEHAHVTQYKNQPMIKRNYQYSNVKREILQAVLTTVFFTSTFNCAINTLSGTSLYIETFFSLCVLLSTLIMQLLL